MDMCSYIFYGIPTLIVQFNFEGRFFAKNHIVLCNYFIVLRAHLYGSKKSNNSHYN